MRFPDSESVKEWDTAYVNFVKPTLLHECSENSLLTRNCKGSPAAKLLLKNETC